MESFSGNLSMGLPKESHAVLKERFRSAALAVTNLYKTASFGHQQGYEDALDDILALLLEDGVTLEGLRNWVIVRKSKLHQTATTGEVSEEDVSASQRQRQGHTTNTVPSPTNNSMKRARKRRLGFGDVFDMDSSSSNKRRRPPA
jgi:hypothetical protein